MKRTYQPKKLQRKKYMVLWRECQLRTAERFWLAEDQKEEQDSATNYLKDTAIYHSA